MIPAVTLQNILSWAMQVAILVGMGGLLSSLFRLRDPRSHLTYCYVLLTVSLALPFVQPWTLPSETAIIHPSDAVSSVSVTQISKVLLNPFWNRTLLWILIAGIVLKLGMFLAGLFRIRRYRKSAVPLRFPKESVLSTYRLIEPEVVIGVSAADIGPVTFGWRRPMILLPGSFMSLEEDSQRAILCHEFLHILRNDWLSNIVEELIGAFLWFHPAIAWLLSQTKLAREQLIDAEVVRLTAAREPYINALLSLAGARSDRPLITALPFLRHRHLTARLRALLVDQNISRGRLWFSYTSMAAALIVSAWIAFSTFPLMAATQIASHSEQESAASVSPTPEPQVEAYTIGDGISAPKVIFRVDPQYSDSARNARIKGMVVLEGVVGTDGTLTHVKVSRSLDPDLDHNAVSAIKQWRFEPGERYGVPVPVKLAVEVNFNLK